MKVFVYGTLKQGYGNHRILEGKPFLGEAVTDGLFDMINAGFPVLIPNSSGLPVRGEVYDITGDVATLDSLDSLEGEGIMYDRREINVLIGNDRVVCSVYVGNLDYWGRTRSQSNLTDSRYVIDGHLEWRRV